MLLHVFFPPRFLNLMYPTGTSRFVINPEAYPLIGDTTGLRTDFLVRNLRVNGNTYDITPWLAYEGKGGESAYTSLQILIQLRIYLDAALTPVTQGKCCWAMGTKGRWVAFWRFTGRDLQRMIPLGWVNAQVSEGPAGNYYFYDLGDNNEWPAIRGILEHIYNRAAWP